ncbi:ESX secretion-associated protein EspG [Nocardia lasii]|uniref:ESX secretion-associated protein EspG n=1 Tax=Nocardia lasii TaxID=1616107 RepID=A0ABW1JNG7_9NOCA
MSWQFTPDEFIYVAQEFGADRFPTPLRLLSSTRYRSEWDALAATLRARIPVRDDPDLLPVLRTIFEPEITVEVMGERRGAIRAYGAIVSDIGVAVVQRPGASPDRGGDLTIRVGSVSIVARMVGAMAGRCGAGSAGRLVESMVRLHGRDPGDSWTSGRSRASIRMRELLAAPRTSSGHVKIGRKGPARYLSWFDVRGDGRYLYSRRGDDLYVDPCGDQQFIDGLRQLIGADERV